MSKKANRTCYAAAFSSCEEGLSREHYVSECLLDDVTLLDASKSSVPLHKELPKNALVAKILCKKHNSALSGCDAEICRLIKEVDSLHNAFKHGVAHTWINRPKSVEIDGLKIEKWALKTIINLVFLQGGDYLAMARELGPYIFGQKAFNYPHGLHLFAHDFTRFNIASPSQNNSILFKPLFIVNNSEVAGYLLVVRGIPLLIWFPWVGEADVLNARLVDDHQIIRKLVGVSPVWHNPVVEYVGDEGKESFLLLKIKLF